MKKSSNKEHNLPVSFRHKLNSSQYIHRIGIEIDPVCKKDNRLHPIYLGNLLIKKKKKIVHQYTGVKTSERVFKFGILLPFCPSQRQLDGMQSLFKSEPEFSSETP